MAKTDKLDINDPDILRRAKTDKDLQERLFIENKNLIWHSLRKWLNSSLIERDDLFQIGAIGFLKAIDGFDPSFGTKFSTYAVPKIWGEVQRWLRDHSLSVHVPRTVAQLFTAVHQLKDLFSVEEIAEKLDIPVSEVIMSMNIYPRSFEEIIHYSSDPLTLGEMIASEKDFESEIIEEMTIIEAMEKLTDRERVILAHKLEKTQMATARAVNMSQAQISRILKRIGKKLELAV